MKMIIAINNEVIENKLVSFYSNKYDILILKSKDEILQVLSLNEEILVITREDLNGTIDFFELLDKNNKSRFVVIIRKLTKELKERLFSKEVFNIIEGESFLFDELIENIETPKMVIYKNKDKILNRNKIFLIAGTRYSGKTIFAKLLSECIAINKNKKILVIDLDFIYPSLDTYIYVEKNNSLIDFMKDYINNSLKKIHNYESNNKKYKNIKYILNTKSIGIPSEDILVNMLNVLKNYYDYIIVDTSTIMINRIYNIYAKLECEIIYLIEESIKSLREYILDTTTIEKNLLLNTKFVVNKSKRNKNILNEIKKNLPAKVSLVIPNYIFINFIIKKNIKIFQINSFLKTLGIVRFEKLKMKIIEKILNIKED